MTINEFNEILDFAIDREREAVAFYKELKEQTKFASQRELLKELEAMEMGHIVVIENIRKKGVSEENIQKTPNLKISEYFTRELDSAELTYQSILIKAMKREENSFRLYSEMSVKFSDEDLSTLFRKLAADEAKHKLYFEKQYDDFISKGN